MLTYFLVLVICLYGTQAQAPWTGMCPHIDDKKDLDLEKLAGTWYEVKGYPHTYEIDTKCVEHQYTLNANGSLDVDIRWKNGKNENLNLKGNAEIFYGGCLGTYSIPIPLGPNLSETDFRKFCILGTDYDTFMVMHACKDVQILFNFFQFQNSWILARDRKPSNDVIKKALQYYASNDLNTLVLRNSNQNGC